VTKEGYLGRDLGDQKDGGGGEGKGISFQMEIIMTMIQRKLIAETNTFGEGRKGGWGLCRFQFKEL